MILVPLFDLKSLGSFRRLQCRDFKSAALVSAAPPLIWAGTVNNRTSKSPVNPLTRLASRSVMRASYSVAAR